MALNPNYKTIRFTPYRFHVAGERKKGGVSPFVGEKNPPSPRIGAFLALALSGKTVLVLV
jgi:hypothetical protein